MSRPHEPLLSVVVPCFDEQDVLRETHGRLTAALRTFRIDYEIVYVDDGSRDATPAILEELRLVDSHVRVVRFARNFGHQVAATAGLDRAAGDAVVLIDADLQDPPEVIGEMLDRWREGYDVAYGRRVSRDGETAFKRATASLFYRTLRALASIDIPPDTGDFRLMDRKVVDALRSMPERDRFLRGMVSWVGFRQVAVPYRREARFAGASKYPLRKMLRLAADALWSFSPVPARIPTWAGLATLAVGFAALLSVAGSAAWTGTAPSASRLALVAGLVVGGLQLLSLGVVAEYAARIYRHAQGRPLYVVAEASGFETEPGLLPFAGVERPAAAAGLEFGRRRFR